MAELSAQDQLTQELAGYYDDPLGFVMFSFPWEKPESGIQMVELPEEYRKRFPNCEYGPDEWACQFLGSARGTGTHARL